MTAVRNHWLSQCYLKSFSIRKKRERHVAVYDAVERKSFRAATRNIALERGFNLVDIEGVERDAFEKQMSAFESEAAPALHRIIATRSLQNQDDRAILLNLVGLFALRNPRQREIYRDFQERVAKQIMALVLATPERYERQIRKTRADGYIKDGLDVSYDQMKAFFEGGEYTIEVATERHIQLEMSTFDKILPLMFARKWMLLRASEGSGGFVTSDHPVCLIWSEPGMRGPIGFGLKKTEVIFPISPELAMIGAFELEDGETDVPIEMVAAVNGTVIRRAERQVYARDQSFIYQMKPQGPPRRATELIKDHEFLQKRYARRAA